MQRKDVKDMLQEWHRRQPGRLDNMLRPLQNVAPSHLADRNLFDFAALSAQGTPPAEGDIAFDDDEPQRDALIAAAQP